MKLGVKGFLKNKEVSNASWLIVGRIFQMILTLVVGILTTRYLGPANYGLVNYGLAYVGFFASVCNLGFNSILVKEFIDNPEEQGLAIGTSLVFKFLSGLMSIIIIFCASLLFDHGQPETILIVVLCSVGILFHIFETFNYWFQSQYKSKIVALTLLIAYFAVSVYKIVLLILGKNVYWFAIATAVDYFAYAVVIYIFYKIYKGPKLRFSWKKGITLLKSSYHYILSGLMVAIYSQTDKIMLKQMISETSVGFYSTASALCTMWVFILSAIIDSIYPTVLRLKKVDKLEYERKNRQMYAIVFYLSVFVSLFLVIFGEYVIKLLYGVEFLPATNVLRICTWFVGLSYLGVARGAWIVSEGKQKFLKYLHFIAAVLNVALNFLLIPILGAEGAALASLCTLICSDFIIPFLIKPLRPNVILMLQSVALIKVKAPKFEVSAEGLVEMQDDDLCQTKLQILDYVDSICKDNGIKYQLVFSALLGAVKSNNLLSANSSIDLIMPREDYKKFINLSRHNSGRYKILCFDTNLSYYLPFAKVYDKTTLVIDNQKKNLFMQGVFINIYAIDNFIEDAKAKKKIDKLLYKFDLSVCKKLDASRNGGVKGLLTKIKYLYYKSKNPRTYMQKIENIKKQVCDSNSSQVVLSNYANTVLNREWLVNSLPVYLNGKQYFAPSEYQKVLTSIYGDYKDYSPQERILEGGNYGYYYR